MSKPIILWAAIVKSRRGEWIDHDSISRLRKDSRTLYLKDFSERWHKEMLSRVRFARVEIKEIT